jgi:NADH:ubiquinone oxidoreductase subunit E
MPATAEIVVCMGSACFARGNSRTVEAVREYLQAQGLEQGVKVTGTLCQNRCRQGPNLEVNGECLCGVDPASLPELLDDRLRQPR